MIRDFILPENIKILRRNYKYILILKYKPLLLAVQISNRGILKF